MAHTRWLGCEGVEEGVVGAVGHIVEVLNADYRRDGLRFSELRSSDIAEADVTDKSLLLEFGEDSDLFGNRAVDRRGLAANAEIDHIKRVEREISEIVVNGVDEFLP